MTHHAKTVNPKKRRKRKKFSRAAFNKVNKKTKNRGYERLTVVVLYFALRLRCLRGIFPFYCALIAVMCLVSPAFTTVK